MRLHQRAKPQRPADSKIPLERRVIQQRADQQNRVGTDYLCS
jgi:hypothetical protein